jgi:hypothetical protein
LERTQPGLPLGIGHIKTKTHDYIRHGTLTLFAALNHLDGKLITRIAKRHRHHEWLAFLKIIDRETPSGLDIHLIADNYATHKHAEVKRWLATHSRFHMHFTPYFVILAQPGRALLSGPYRLHHRAEFRLGRRTVGGDCRLSRRAQQKYQALRVARQGRGHPAQDRGGTAGDGCHPDIIIMFSYLRDGALAAQPS